MAKVIKNIKLVIIILIALTITVMCLFSFGTNTASAYEVALTSTGEDSLGTFFDGQGKANDPYLLESPEHLELLSEITNSTDQTLNKYFMLSNNVDMGGRNFVPIGNLTSPFRGKFLGNGKVITNLSVNTVGLYAGLFGYIDQSAEVEKLGIFSGSITGGQYVGGIAGFSKGVIRNSFSRADVTSTGMYAGGIAGQNEGQIINSYNVGSVTTQSQARDSYAGGVAGISLPYQNNSKDSIAFSYNLGNVSGNGYLGGVVGGRVEQDGMLSSIRYSYFNSDNFVGFAIGDIGEGGENITIPGGNQVRGLSNLEWRETTLQGMAFTHPDVQGSWKKSYLVNDQSAYFAPNLTAFDDNHYYSYNSVILRRYGIKSNGTGDWGSEGNPYVIENPSHLLNLSNAVNNNISSTPYEGKYFVQSNDIDMAGINFAPIGNYSENKPFSGSYDGGNNKISNLAISRSGNYVAMFGYMSSISQLKNLTFDASCSFSGENYVASAVGYNAGKIENVETRASVSGQREIAGIVGYNNGGELKNILSVPKLALNAGGSNAHGVIGLARNSKTQNVWYMTNASSGYISVATGGRLLLVGKNGEVSAQKNANGQITFVQSSSNELYRVEFREINEQVVGEHSYAPEMSSTATTAIYARFVRTVNVLGVSNGTIRLISPINGQPLEGSLKYYEGQKINLSVSINEGFFFDKTVIKDIYGGDASSGEIEYTYDDERERLLISFDMGPLYSDIGGVIYPINASPIEDRIYDGEATVYSYVKSGYENYTYEYNYGTQSAPINAGNYTLSVFVKLDGVQRGRERVDFTINKRPIYVPESALTKIKEYDGKGNLAVHAPVDQQIVASYNWEQGKNIVTRDIVAGGTENRVIVNSTASYSDAIVGTGKTVTYTFSLSGISAPNYVLAEPSTSYGGGEIVPRTVVYEIKDTYLSRVYDGNIAAIERFSTVSGYSLVSISPITPRIEFEGEGLIDGKAINVGVYTLKITATGNDVDFYNLELKEDYLFTVKPKPVEVTFTDYDLTYNTEVQSVGGYFFDVNGKKQVLTPQNFTYQYFDGEDYIPAPLINAGEYIAKVTLTGNYTATDTENGNQYKDTKDITMKKAPQNEFRVQPFDKEYTYGDSDITPIVTGEMGSGEVTFEVVSGFASIIDGKVSLEGGGDITIKATKAESANYLMATATYSFSVNKANIIITLEDIVSKYGDKVEFSFVFEGFVDKDSGLTSPAGFIPPTISIDGEVYEENAFYPVKLSEEGEIVSYLLTLEENGIANGYILDYSEVGSPTLTIIKKEIAIVAENKTGTYGDQEDIPLTFRVYDEVGEEILVGEYNLDITLFRHIGRDVGKYTITCGQGSYLENLAELANKNTNYDILFTEGVYTIVPKNLVLKMIGGEGGYNQKVYGTPDPILVMDEDFTISGIVEGDTLEEVIWSKSGGNLSSGITRREGENAYSLTNPAQGYGFYPYIGTNLATSPNYTLVFETINLRIYPATPTIQEKGEMLIQYGDPLSSLNPSDAVLVTVDGVLEWENEEYIPDFTEQAKQHFKVVFTSGNRNYLDTQIFVTVGVVARELTVEFIGEATSTYNGKVQNLITYTIHNAVWEDDLRDKVTYYYQEKVVDEIKNAGEYTAVVTIDNGNYILVEQTEIVITIKKAVLEIYLDDIILPEGEVPEKNFIYEGFVGGEDEKVLLSPPDITFLTEPGNYEITPSGAEAENYQIVYRTSKQSVAKTRATSDVLKFELRGNFNYLMELELKEVRKAENQATYNTISQKYEQYKATDSSLSKMKLSGVYDISLLVEDEPYSVQGKTRASLELPTRLRETKDFEIILIKKDGSMVIAENLVRENNTLSFDMEDCDYFAIVSPPDYTWIILSVVIALLIIGVLSLDMISERMGIGRHKNKKK